MTRRWLTSILLFVACTAPASTPGYEVMDTKLEALRSAFNRASGKVRAVFLASPT